MQLDNSDLLHIRSESFQCFLANALDILNPAIGECEDVLMVAIGQFRLILDGEGHRTDTASHADGV